MLIIDQTELQCAVHVSVANVVGKKIYSENIKIYYIRYWKVVFLRTLFNCPSSFGNPKVRNNLNMKKESFINFLSQVKSVFIYTRTEY